VYFPLHGLSLVIYAFICAFYCKKYALNTFVEFSASACFTDVHVCVGFFLYGKRTYQSKNSTVSAIRKCPPKTLGNSHGGVSWFNRFSTTKNCTCSLMK